MAFASVTTSSSRRRAWRYRRSTRPPPMSNTSAARPRPISGPGSGTAGRGPRQQVVGRHGVDDAVERYIPLGGPVVPVRLSLQLAGRVRVGVDREPAAVLDRQVEQLARP